MINPKDILKPCTMLNNGEYFYFDNPWLGQYDIVTIAKSLSKLCRFTGHCRTFYSVAQHSVLVSQLCSSFGLESAPVRDHALAGLLHDAPEMVMNDLSTPVKNSIGSDYRKIYGVIEKDLLSRWGLKTLPYVVKHMDLCALKTEVRDLMPLPRPGQGVHWVQLNGLVPRGRRIIPLPATLAEWQFIARFDQVGNFVDLHGKYRLHQHWLKNLIGRLLLRIC